MSEELENKEGLMSQSEVNREGYSATGQSGYQREYSSVGGRAQRPRIQTPRAYGSSNDGGFRPEGFGAGLQNNATPNDRQTGYRPRTNNYNNGYQPRQANYQPRQQQNNYRPRYNNNNEEGGYQMRQPSYQNRGGYQPRQQQEGYRPRYNNNNGENNFQNRPQQNAYRPRYNNVGENAGYQPNNGYQNRGYQNNRNPYQNRGYQNNRGFQNNGYPNQRGGYQNNRPNFNQGGNRRPANQGYDPNAKYSLKKRIEYKEEHIDPNEPLRLNKYLANAGVCSRREADEFIQTGVVTVNGAVVTELGTKILRSDEVKFKDQLVTLEKKVYVLLNKPKDYVTTSEDPQQRKTVMDLVKGICPERIYPVGRLDKNTTGVLLLTNDGDLASKLTHPKFLKKKVYHVYLDKPVEAQTLQQISDGIQLEDGEIKADAIEYADEKDQSQVGIEIHSGKNRIVRRIFESLGYRVVKLDRVQFAGLTKKNLRRGDWRFLTEQEVDMLRMGAFE